MCQVRAADRLTDLGAELERLRAAGLLRATRTVESAPGAHVRLDGRDVLLLCSNDYLGLAEDARVRAAAARAAERWGAGAGASRLVSGNLALHRELEDDLAAFKGTEGCVLFGSGFLANVGVVAALAGAGEVVLSDELNHASLVDGCRLARAETIVYAHADLDALVAGLERAAGRRATIVTDSVFSMDGDRAPLEGIVDAARGYGARVVVDEAHATGVVGASGRGLVAELALEREVDVVVGTLSKALGSYGAFACCDAEMAAYLVNRARTVIFSTGLPPAAAGAALEALRIIREEPQLVARLHRNARTLRSELAAQGLAVDEDDMPIVPIIAGAPAAAVGLSETLLERGIFAQPIRPPTVPPGTSRLRLVAMASHDEAELRAAARTIGALGGRTLA
jgi:8-amino-7-oxononanoate synthase